MSDNTNPGTVDDGHYGKKDLTPEEILAKIQEEKEKNPSKNEPPSNENGDQKTTTEEKKPKEGENTPEKTGAQKTFEQLKSKIKGNKSGEEKPETKGEKKTEAENKEPLKDEQKKPDGANQEQISVSQYLNQTYEGLDIPEGASDVEVVQALIKDFNEVVEQVKGETSIPDELKPIAQHLKEGGTIQTFYENHYNNDFTKRLSDYMGKPSEERLKSHLMDNFDFSEEEAQKAVEQYEMGGTLDIEVKKADNQFKKLLENEKSALDQRTTQEQEQRKNEASKKYEEDIKNFNKAVQEVKGATDEEKAVIKMMVTDVQENGRTLFEQILDNESFVIKSCLDFIRAEQKKPATRQPEYKHYPTEPIYNNSKTTGGTFSGTPQDQDFDAIEL